MRVLISASTFPLDPGDGLPRFVYDLCQALATHVDKCPTAQSIKDSVQIGWTADIS